MTSTEKHAGSYRGYPTDDRNLRPLTIALVTIVAVWLAVYLLGSAADRLNTETGDPTDSSSPALSLVGP